MNSAALTVIMMMPYSFARLQNGITCLRQQTVRDQIEFVLMHRPGAAEEIDPEQFCEFHSFRCIELTEEFYMATGFAAGFHASTAPVVAYVEDHVLINREWAAAILEAHRGPWVAVAPAMENANHPKSIIARTAFLEGFVEWYGHRKGCPVSSGPGHNTSYKRAALEPFSDRLAALYASERNLAYELEAAGGKMLIEPRAVTRHVNISKFGAVLGHAYYGGRIFGGQRGLRMSLLGKFARTILAPAVPILRIWRIAKILRKRRKFADIGFLGALPSLVVALIFHATGEVIGYWGGVSSAQVDYRQYEMNRLGCVAERDRALLFPPTAVAPV